MALLLMGGQKNLVRVDGNLELSLMKKLRNNALTGVLVGIFNEANTTQIESESQIQQQHTQHLGADLGSADVDLAK